MAGKWAYAKVGQVARRVTKGTTPTTVGGRFIEAGIAFVKVESITNDGRFDPAKFAYIDKETNQILSRSMLQENDILFTIAGTIGRVARVSSSILPANTNQAVAIIRPNTEIIDPRFIYYVLRDESRIHYAHSRVVQSVQANFSLSELSEIDIPLPDKASQKAIACILGTLDDKIDLNRRMNETLESMARAIFKSWFVDFDPVIDNAPNAGNPIPDALADKAVRRKEALARARAEGRPAGLPEHMAGLFPDGFEESEPGYIPKGWEVGTLGDVAYHPRRGVQPADIDTATPYIALEHMPRCCLALSDWATADGIVSNKFEFKMNEILFGKLRPYFHKVGIAPLDGVCSTDIVVLAPKSKDWFGFILGHVSSHVFIDYTNAGSTGTKMPRTSWGEMSRYAVVMPPKRIAGAFSDLIRPATDRIISSVHESRTLASLRDTLLPKLISGEIRVREAEQAIRKFT